MPYVKRVLRSRGTRRSEPRLSNSGNTWSQPVSPCSGLSSTISLCRAFTMWQKHKRTLCSQQGPKSSAHRRSRPFAWPCFSLRHNEAPFSFHLTVYLRWVNGPSSEIRHNSFSLSRTACRCYSPCSRDLPCTPVSYRQTGRGKLHNIFCWAQRRDGVLQTTAFNFCKPSPALPGSLDLCLGSLA